MFRQAGVRGLALAAATFVGLLLLYQGLIWGGLLPPSNGLTQWENNVVRAERYVFEPAAEAPVVLVGSSLTTNIMAHAGWDAAINLGMNAGATQTGLELLRRAPGRPGVVLVELNDTIARGADMKLVNGIVGPGAYQLRQALPMLRTEYRPMSVLIRILATADNDPAAAPARPGGEARMSNFDQRQRQRAVERAYPGLMEPLPAEKEALIRAEAALIQAQIAELERAGWRVLLTDIPRDSQLATTTQETQVRAMLAELFPADRYTWLPAPPAREWATRDGSHLVRADAQAFAAFLRDQVSSIVAAAPTR